MVGVSSYILNSKYLNKLNVNRLNVNFLLDNINKSINENDIYNFILSWLKDTESGNPDLPFKYFNENAILFATVSNEFKNTPEQIYNYFNFFIRLPNLMNNIVKYDIKKLDYNTWGFYANIDWSYGIPKTTINARMSFIVKVDYKNNLSIIHLHSSPIPDN